MRDGAGMRVLVVDDHALVAQSLALGLRREGITVEVADTEDAVEVVEHARRFRPNVVVLDLQLGDRIGSGRDLVVPLQEASGGRVIILTAVTERFRLAECLEAGASRITSKAEQFERLLDDVIATGRGECPRCDAVRDELLRELAAERESTRQRFERFNRLTPREQEVLQGMADGKSLQEMAAESFVAEGTLRCQAKAVLRKLEVRSQVAAAAAAHHAGWTLHPQSA